MQAKRARRGKAAPFTLLLLVSVGIWLCREKFVGLLGTVDTDATRPEAASSAARLLQSRLCNSTARRSPRRVVGTVSVDITPLEDQLPPSSSLPSEATSVTVYSLVYLVPLDQLATAALCVECVIDQVESIYHYDRAAAGAPRHVVWVLLYTPHPEAYHELRRAIPSQLTLEAQRASSTFRVQVNTQVLAAGAVGMVSLLHHLQNVRSGAAGLLLPTLRTRVVFLTMGSTLLVRGPELDGGGDIPDYRQPSTLWSDYMYVQPAEKVSQIEFRSLEQLNHMQPEGLLHQFLSMGDFIDGAAAFCDDSYFVAVLKGLEVRYGGAMNVFIPSRLHEWEGLGISWEAFAELADVFLQHNVPLYESGVVTHFGSYSVPSLPNYATQLYASAVLWSWWHSTGRKLRLSTQSSVAFLRSDGFEELRRELRGALRRHLKAFLIFPVDTRTQSPFRVWLRLRRLNERHSSIASADRNCVEALRSMETSSLTAIASKCSVPPSVLRTNSVCRASLSPRVVEMQDLGEYPHRLLGSALPTDVILVSVQVVECAGCLLDQLDNIHFYCPRCVVVVNAKPDIYHATLETLRLGPTHTPNVLWGQVLLNPHSFNTTYSYSTVLPPHVSNVRFASSVPWTHVVFFASNERLIRHGLAQYVQQYDSVDPQSPFSSVGTMGVHPHTFNGLPYFVPLARAVASHSLLLEYPNTAGRNLKMFCDTTLRRAMHHTGSTHIPTTHFDFEGFFLRRKLWDVFDDALGERYNKEQVFAQYYFPEHTYFLSILYPELRRINDEKLGHVVTTFLPESVWSPDLRWVDLERTLQAVLKHMPYIYSVKRMPRTVNNSLMAFLRSRRQNL